MYICACEGRGKIPDLIMQRREDVFVCVYEREIHTTQLVDG